MSRLWPPQIVHQPPLVTTLRCVTVPRIPRVREIGRIVVLVIRPARYLVRLVKRLTVRVRHLTDRVRARPLLSPLLLDRPPPTSGVMA
jgi:hypothetical protein